MARARNTESKRSKSPSTSIFKSAPAQVMVPRLMVGLAALALVVLGLVMVYSSSSITAFIEEGDSTGEAIKQCIFVVIGIVCAIAIVLFIKTDTLYGLGGYLFWGGCIVLLLLTPVLGTSALGAKRWIVLGPVSIQVSEFIKIAFILMAARIAQDYRQGEIDLHQTVARSIVYIILPLAFLFLTQSDLGTTLICCVGLLVVMMLSGLSSRVLLVIIGAGILFGILAIAFQGYRSGRIESFLDPWGTAQEGGYQLVHSFKALAAGGLFGVGIGNSYEKLQYLPEAETDFIFAIIGEEMGLIGAVLVIVAFLAILRGGFMIASQSRSSYGRCVAAGLTTMVVFQAFLNIACVAGLFPTTGKPLPFISSGGSSMLSSLVLVGVILAISFDSHNEGEYRQRRDNLHVVSSYNTGNRQGSSSRNEVLRTRFSEELPRESGEVLRSSLRVIRGGGQTQVSAIHARTIDHRPAIGQKRNARLTADRVPAGSAMVMESRASRVARR